jgi:uncharacterized membrane protein (DUF2068 family)
MPKPTALAAPRGRPFGLFVLAGLLLLKSVLLVLVVAGAYLQETGPLRDLIALPLEVFTALRETPLAGIATLSIVAALALSAAGLLGGRRWGWVGAMVTTGIFLATDIYAFSEGSANHLWMVLNVVTVFYLNQAEVRRVVGVASATSAAGGQDR